MPNTEWMSAAASALCSSVTMAWFLALACVGLSKYLSMLAAASPKASDHILEDSTGSS